MAQRRRMRILSSGLVMVALSICCLTHVAQAQPTADQVLTDAGLSAGDKQNVMKGQFVNVSVGGVSDRDLSFAIAFLVKTPPETLAKQIAAGELITADTQVKAFGELSGEGSVADFAKLTLTADEAKALSSAKAGDALNLSASEIAAFKAPAGGSASAVQEQLRRMLLARYQAYRASGLAGIAPYDRGSGRTSDPASDLRKASQATKGLQKYMPAFQKVLLDYPQATLPGMQDKFFWLKSLIHDQMTYVLAHILVAADGPVRVVTRREYYVSTGYNAEQSGAGFLPVQGGTVGVTSTHAFTDQVTGAGGSMKRGIGSKVMAGKMKEIYEAARDRSQKQR
jgi:hypothetical protein